MEAFTRDHGHKSPSGTTPLSPSPWWVATTDWGHVFTHCYDKYVQCFMTISGCHRFFCWWVGHLLLNHQKVVQHPPFLQWNISSFLISHHSLLIFNFGYLHVQFNGVEPPCLQSKFQLRWWMSHGICWNMFKNATESQILLIQFLYLMYKSWIISIWLSHHN